MAERRGHAVWHGNLLEGSGTVDAASGAVSSQEVTWKARTEGSDTVTSPEELIAAAEAACFAMALSHALASAGHEPEEVEVDAVCTFGPVEGGFAITRMALDVRAAVPGIDQAAFEGVLAEAEAGCPVSNALRGNVEIDVRGRLA
jgi:osmotically inducible protein OsmC